MGIQYLDNIESPNAISRYCVGFRTCDTRTELTVRDLICAKYKLVHIGYVTN